MYGSDSNPTACEKESKKGMGPGAWLFYVALPWVRRYSMPMSTQREDLQSSQTCQEHNQPAKWICNHCGKSICSVCKPVAFNYQVFHRECLNQVNQKTEKTVTRSRPLDAPSAGVRGIAWFFMVVSVLLFGVALLLIGVALFSHHYVPMMTTWMGSMPSLDDVPGGRVFLGWLSFIAMAGSILQFFIGMGLLNCLPGARRAVLIFSWLEVILAGLGWLVVLVAGEGFWDIPVFAVVFIVYFSRKDVRRQFEPNSELIEVHR